MSSTYLSSTEMNMLDRLLAEIQESGIERGSDLVTVQARLLVRAFESGMSGEANLRELLAEHLKSHAALALSFQRWENDAEAPFRRREHALPSPEEEFNAAESINAMADPAHRNRAIIGRNAVGETARIELDLSGVTEDGIARWIRSDTGEGFDAIHWVETTWTAAEVLAHSANGGHHMV